MSPRVYKYICVCGGLHCEYLDDTGKQLCTCMLCGYYGHNVINHAQLDKVIKL